MPINQPLNYANLQAMGAGPSSDALAITPNDTVDLQQPVRALYIGTAGHVRLITLAGTDVVFQNVPRGILPVGARRVFSTTGVAGDNATAIVGLV